MERNLLADDDPGNDPPATLAAELAGPHLRGGELPVTGAVTAVGRPELAWLAEVLWGPTPGSSCWWAARCPAGSRPPSGGGPARPAAAAGAGAAGLEPGRRRGVRQYSDGMTQRAPLAKAAVGLALRSGALPCWLRRRGLVVAAGVAEDPCSATTSRPPSAAPTWRPRSCSAPSGPTASRWSSSSAATAGRWAT